MFSRVLVIVDSLVCSSRLFFYLFVYVYSFIFVEGRGSMRGEVRLKETCEYNVTLI